MADVTPPGGIDIPSMRNRKDVQYRLMVAGPGVPWENRDEGGPVGGFLKTCRYALSKPRTMFHLVRRIETQDEARKFAIGCGVLWAVSALIHAGLRYVWALRDSSIEVDAYSFWMRHGLGAAVVGAAVVGLLTLAVKVFYPMVSAEDMKGKGSPTLVYNLFAYALGPSLLALIPLVGPAAAVIWIVGDLVIASADRLRVSVKGTFVGLFITVLVCLAVVAVGGYLIQYVGGVVLPEWATPTAPVATQGL